MSSKKNPLFLDSTKSIGGKVVTKVELELGPDEKELHQDCKLFIQIIDQFGFEQKFPLGPLSKQPENFYGADIWLKYQHEIHFRFVFMLESEIKTSSKFRRASAGHIISEKWQSCPESEINFPPSYVQATRRNEFMQGLKATSEERSGKAKGLVDASQLSQLKSLLKDLL